MRTNVFLILSNRSLFGRVKHSFTGVVEKAPQGENACGAFAAPVAANARSSLAFDPVSYPPLRLTLSSGEAAYRRAKFSPPRE